MANIKIFALGGQDERGKSSYAIDVNNEVFVIDAGIKVPTTARLGIDLIIPNFSYIVKNIERVKGIFISHAHDENFAALPWLLMQVPNLKIYASKYTVEVMQNRFSKYNIKNNNYELIVIDNPVQFEHATISSFELAHSIHGTVGFNIKTEDGSIIYMSDFTLGQPIKSYGETDLNKILQDSSSKGVLALLLDSSTSNFRGKSMENVLVTNHIESFYNNTNKDSRIIVGAFDEITSVLYEVILLAQKSNRPIAMYGRTFAELYDLAIKQGLLKIDNIKIINYKEIEKHNNVIVIITGQRNRLYQRFERIAENNDVYLKYKENDSTIVIAPPLNGQEKSYTHMLDSISKIAPRLITTPEKKLYSYNPSYDDILEVAKFLKPKFFIPIKGLYRYLVTAKQAVDEAMTNTRKVILLNGKTLEIGNGQHISENQMSANVLEVFIDGFGIGDVSQSIIREREQLSKFGLVYISIILDKKNNVVDKPQIEMRGVVDIKLKENILDIISSNVLEIIEASKNEWNYKEVQLRIKKKLRRVINKQLNKEPIIIPIFYKIN